MKVKIIVHNNVLIDVRTVICINWVWEPFDYVNLLKVLNLDFRYVNNLVSNRHTLVTVSVENEYRISHTSEWVNHLVLNNDMNDFSKDSIILCYLK